MQMAEPGKPSSPLDPQRLTTSASRAAHFAVKHPERSRYKHAESQYQGAWVNRCVTDLGGDRAGAGGRTTDAE